MRYTSAERRKLYRTTRWNKLRKAILDRDGWRCRTCGKAGRLEVHHVQSPFFGAPMWEPENLRAVCRPCHWRGHQAARKAQGRAAMSQHRREWWDWIEDGA